MKTTNKRAKFKILKPFVFFFAFARERIFIKTLTVESRYVTGPENILCAGAGVNFSATEILQIVALNRRKRTENFLRYYSV